MLLTGCGSNSIKPQISKIEIIKEVRKPVICLESPELDHIKWETVILIEAKSLEGLNVIGIDESQYKNLAKNWQRAKKAIIDRNSIIEYYKKCINNHNFKSEKENENK